MSNFSRLVNEYCGNETNVLIWNEKTNFLSPCFLFTLIELPIYFLASVILSFLIGVLKLPDELDRLIQTKKLGEKVFLVFKLLCVITILLFTFIDSKKHYFLIYGADYNGCFLLFFKTLTYLLVIFYTIKSFKCFNYSLSKLIVINFLLATLIIVEIIDLNWVKKEFFLNSFLNRQLFFCYLKIIFIFIYFSLINFAYFFERRHSLFYESFARYNDSTFNLERLIDLNDYKKNTFSTLFFTWVKPFLKKSANNQIQRDDDLFHLPPHLNSDHVKKQLSVNYNENSEINLWKLLKLTFKKDLFSVGYLKIISDVLGFFSPIFLSNLITYIDSNDISKLGFYYTLALFLTSIFSTVCLNLYDFYINNVSLKVKSSILGLVYKKIFKLRTSTLHDNFNNGQLINFASVDADRIGNLCSNILLLLSMPFQIIFALYLLYNQIGISFLSGFIFSLFILPINKLICNKIASLTTEMLKHKDDRIKFTSKLISGIKTIKMNCWENIFTNKIQDYRQKEIKMLTQKKYLDAICVFFWAVTPVLTSFLTFSTFTLLGNKLTASNVFTSLALLNILINPLNSFPWVVQGFMESWVSLKRIEKFLNENNDENILEECEEVKISIKKNLNEYDNLIELDDVVCQKKSKDNERFLLGPIDLKVKKGELIQIVGTVGSGKTSFLEAILNEVPFKKNGFLKSGFIKINLNKKGIGYVAQQPWVQNGTIRSNILFGKSFEYKFYNEVIDVCNLRKDLEVFNDYDNTLVGDKGFSLSGGQKCRLALARAIYQNFDVYLIDDPFSSLDIHVASNLYENCIVKFLSEKTRIVCSHHCEFIHKADRVIILENGCVSKIGKPEEVLNFSRTQNTFNLNAVYKSVEQEDEKKNDLQDNVFKEELNHGFIKFSIYTSYFKEIGIYFFAMIIIFFLLMQLSKLTSDFWLSIWIDGLKLKNYIDSLYYLEIFSIILIINLIFASSRSISFAIGNLIAAKKFHEKLYKTVLSSNLNFFSVRPFGQIINRFSSDVNNIDDNLPFTLNIFLTSLIGILATFSITIFSLPSILIIFVLIIFPYYEIQFYYRVGSMKLKRICSNTLSPIYSQFYETISGLTTIRSYQAVERFTKHFEEKVDMNNSAQYSLKACTQWLNLRLQFIGSSISTSIALLAVVFHYYGFEIHTTLIGLILAYSLTITSTLNSFIQTFTQLEMDMVSVERIQQYLRNSEKEITGKIKLENFPKKGSIEFEDVYYSYKNDGNYSLNGISFSIKPGEFVGIVGRTGAGKSSIFLALFKLFQIKVGKIKIDDINIENLELFNLRSKLGIITQDPFLFEGTIKMNLDPFQKYSDSKIWEAIQKCGFKPLILKLGGLNGSINEHETNISCGEKQIICLIRAFLNQVKILCLDEITSSIDDQTETNLFKTIRRSFSNSTILMIAHKPSSVLNCDKIMVINDGKVKEMNTPDKLISNPNSFFHKMWYLQEQNLNKTK